VTLFGVDIRRHLNYQYRPKPCQSSEAALQYRVFVAVHVDFNEIQAVYAFALDEAVQI
jgi:hypothetical protein